MMQIHVVASHEAALRGIEDHLEASLPDRPLQVVDAGCGRSADFRLDPRRRVTMTAIDLDAAALRARSQERGDLDRAIVGDIREPGLVPEQSADLVVSAFVLEHIEGAGIAFANLARWLRPGGQLVIHIPDRQTAYGFVTRLTPHRVHVWYHRRLRHQAKAGEPGRGPYPTVHEKAISRQGIRALCRRHGLEIRHEYLVNTLADCTGPHWAAIKAGLSALSLLSGGRLAADHTNLAYVLERRP